MEKNAKVKSGGILKGAFIISLGALVAKILGAIYRVPLTNILKSEGLGVYQTVFPVYSILLVFSSSGVPSALAKLVSSGDDGEKVLSRAAALFLPLGFIGSLLMAFSAPLLAAAQGNPQAKYAYIALSPSVFLVSALSCARGFFQGENDMLPTALSQITEQTVKLAAGLTLCYLFRSNYAIAGAAACVAVTLSELAAVLFMAIKLKKRGVKTNSFNNGYSLKKIIATAFPVTLSAILLPLARAYDSFTVINILKSYTENAVGLYGVYTGSVESVVGVPVALCYGAAVASLPVISSLLSKNDDRRARKKIFGALLLTLLLSALAATALFIFSGAIVNLLFGGLAPSERETAARLLSFSGVNVVLLALVQTSASILVAIGKPYVSCASLGAGLIVKAILQIFLLKIEQINIFGVLYSDISCYLIAVFCNLVYIIKYKPTRNAEYETYTCLRRRGRRRFNP